MSQKNNQHLTPKTKLKWFDNNPFFFNKEGYDAFVDAMITAAREKQLPICLKHDDPEVLTIGDIKQFSQVFMKDTGLNIECQLFTCKDCGKLHCALIVSEWACGN